ncbi:MAG: hypothetical protein ABW032_01280 [Burkholderiaceae bacterium]
MMRSATKAWAALAAVSLTACAAVADVVATGPDSYRIPARAGDGGGSAGEQRAVAIRRASDYCNAKSLQMKLGDARPIDPRSAAAPEAQVDFRCVQP